MDFVTEAFASDIEEDIALQYDSIDSFVMGRKTFDSLSGYWPTPAARNERLVDYMNDRRKLVLSANKDVSAWQNSEHLGDDPTTVLREYRRIGAGDMMIIGSAKVVQSLAAKELIDEYRFLLFPSVVGQGRSLFDSNAKSTSLTLVREHRFSNGVIALDYRPRD